MSDTQDTVGVLEAILQHNQHRKPKLVRLKLRRMLEDPFTFFRGAIHLFARDWSELCPPEVGPDILICGDLHLENFALRRRRGTSVTTSTTSTSRWSLPAAWTSSGAQPVFSWPPSSGG